MFTTERCWKLKQKNTKINEDPAVDPEPMWVFFVSVSDVNYKESDPIVVHLSINSQSYIQKMPPSRSRT